MASDFRMPHDRTPQIIIDTDPGQDDAAALMLAFASPMSLPSRHHDSGRQCASLLHEPQRANRLRTLRRNRSDASSRARIAPWCAAGDGRTRARQTGLDGAVLPRTDDDGRGPACGRFHHRDPAQRARRHRDALHARPPHQYWPSSPKGPRYCSARQGTGDDGRRLFEGATSPRLPNSTSMSNPMPPQPSSHRASRSP